MTYATLKISGLPPSQVIGSGTSAGQRQVQILLGQHCQATQNIHAYIIGEHGDSEVPAWSITNIAGMPIEHYCFRCGRACSADERPGSLRM